jgi:preprotein translocase subunit SecY
VRPPSLCVHLGRVADQVLPVLVQLIGTWEAKEGSAQLYATSGIAYYMSPPLNFHDALIDPIHTLVYITFVITACAVFSKVYTPTLILDTRLLTFLVLDLD